jgi:hypothetical protein
VAPEEERVGEAIAESAAARAHVIAVSTRFPIGASVGASFATDGAHAARALLPSEAKQRATRSASVSLPLRASDDVSLEDETTRVAVRFRLSGATDAPLSVADGIAVYVGALGGSDVVHRVHSEGTEDYVVFETRPENESLAYDVDVSRVAGLRLVSNTLEFLDDGGTPRLRVAPPFVVDESGAHTEATIAIEGCAYDTNGAAPWGRPVTRAGSSHCRVMVTWHTDRYPAMVDPSWVATGNMVTARTNHTATLLSSGDVLIAGGNSNGPISSAELFDGTSSFAATGSMTSARQFHCAVLLKSGNVLVAGGLGSNWLSSAELFDGVSKFTATTSALPTFGGRQTATLLLPSSSVLIAGGNDGTGNATSNAALFDGVGMFSATGPMNAARLFHTATLLPSGQVLVAGGYAGGVYLSTAETFDGVSKFTTTTPMQGGHAYHAAARLGSGKVLIAGGLATNGIATSAAELFDGTSFALTGAMGAVRQNHSMTALPTGRVLVAGGDDASNARISTAELFDGISAFSATTPMSTPRGQYHTATLLPSGRVLVTGDSVATSSAEMFLVTPGGACKVGADCSSGVCDDNICCAAACPNNGVCQTCVANTGACAPVTNQPDPDTCSGTSSCDPSGACVANMYCTSDANCFATHYCDPTGHCQPQKMQGAQCNQAAGADCLTGNCRDCATGFCADGVCCDTACNGACSACTAALKGQGMDGTCGNAPADTNPHAACVKDPGYPASCKSDGLCDGNGACRQYAPNTIVCTSTGSCVGTQLTGALCNGFGSCVAGQATDCAPFACESGACKTTCATNADCAPTAYCTPSHTCLPRAMQGGTCMSDSQCEVGNYCVDGVCCDQPCTGQCEACDVAMQVGSCFPLSTGAPHGARAACNGGGSMCGGACTSQNRNACTYPTSATSCGSTCAGDKETDSACDGNGQCVAGAPFQCPGNLKCADAMKCTAKCMADPDCEPGFGCQNNVCVVKSATCDGDHTVTSVDGMTKTDCAPYKCIAGGSCGSACQSVNDCVAPNECDPSGHCVPSAAPSDSSGGCDVAAVSMLNDGRAAIAACAIVVAAASLRRRRRSTPM